ncbi:hypothetical protein PACTADRAFT_36691 [Pachysolen tannophilus NRRL Y-2460]|uniref:Uncharacterized protein n=1 Tax=Pachysolen tannophilus NRRL Y-2460 TaxID=669874 RepID=A0A1E4U0Y9_PACTA|nr:hypothetical protein PACTADRAFT_36691 [Pachysolen tannophilus NRRL Y-2460]
MTSSVPITENLMKSFQASKTFKYHKVDSPITSIDFDDSGQYLISSGVDESIQLYDVNKGKHSKSIFSKKYGVHLARFTHHEKNCLYASTKEDHTIRYLSLHDNSYLRYFRGHRAQVTALEMAPVDDVFLSSAYDDSVRVWDLRSSACQGFMNCKAPSLISFDPTGMVFGIGSNNTNEIGLYDFRNYDKDPFATFDINVNMNWNKLEFSNDGKYLIVTDAANECHLVVDAFDGVIRAKLIGTKKFPNRNYPSTGSTTISPDGRFVYGGSGNRSVMIWDLQEIQKDDINKQIFPCKELNSDQGLPRMCLFNPRMLTFATADTAVTLWLTDSKNSMI